jgi:hypothetical protein
MGPTLIVMAAALLKDQDGIKQLARDFVDNRPLVFVTGVFTLLGGLAVVIHHNIWVADWPLSITIVGWAMVVGGIIRIAFPELVKSWGEKMLEPQYGGLVIGIVWLLIGALLSFVGYF